MANADLQRGFKPFGRIGHVGIYVAASTIYPGDMVEQETGAANTTQFRMRCAVANVGPLLGAAANYATAGQIVRVYDDPAQIFICQASAADIDANDDLGLNYSIIANAADATYRVSRQELDSSTGATTATLELKLLGINKRQDGKNAFGANVECLVKINNHQLGSHTGTAGV